MRTRLLALAAIAITMACHDTRLPTESNLSPPDPSKILSDGAHGGNKDFWWLPPMVPLPIGNPDFKIGTFNNALRPSLRLDICELYPEMLNGVQVLPKATTQCNGGPIKSFLPGSVNLVNLPLTQNGWWTLFNLPPDGFYYVLWDTRQSNLNVSKYYRIKAYIDGDPDHPLGIADVDPMSSLREWKYTLTGQVIQLVDDVLLPIPFRVEQGALCASGTFCSSATITAHTADHSDQVVQTQGDNGPIAGAVFPDGWLPSGVDRVVVTITSVNTGQNNVGNGTQQFPCHPNLHLQQFNGCFNFSTIPALPKDPETGAEFAKAVTVVTCFVLHNTDDQRAPYAQLFSSGPNEPAHPLESVGDAEVLTVESQHNCGDNFVTLASSNRISSNRLVRFANAGWSKFKASVGRIFGVKTAYAVDLGLGGFTTAFSNVSPAINARMSGTEFEPDFSAEPGSSTLVTARVVGTTKHEGGPTNSGNFDTGIPGFPVTFALESADGGGFRSSLASELQPAAQLDAITNSGPIVTGSEGSGGGFAGVVYDAPLIAGHYTFHATSPYAPGDIAFHVFVRPTLASVAGQWLNENATTRNIVDFNLTEDGGAVSMQVFGQCSPDDCDWGYTDVDTSLWDTQQQLTAVWDQGFAVKTVTVKWLSATRLQVTTHAAFTPTDGRADYTVVEFFHPVQ